MMSKRISKKMLKNFLDSIANVKPIKIGDENKMSYRSKIDDSYITFVGMEDKVKYLLKNGIIEQLQNGSNRADHTTNIGFNPEEQKWYGWSHRAIYGFTIGSTVKQGDCAYIPFDKEDFLKDCVRFWDDENHLDTHGEHAIDDGKEGVQVNWTYDNKVPNKKIRGTISGIFTEYPDSYGKGEWAAKTMDDAKQMAIDFAEGVG
jgi:hypothetical protein